MVIVQALVEWHVVVFGLGMVLDVPVCFDKSVNFPPCWGMSLFGFLFVRIKCTMGMLSGGALLANRCIVWHSKQIVMV